MAKDEGKKDDVKATACVEERKKKFEAEKAKEKK